MLQDDIGIIGWQKNSFIDFPGTVSTVLFFRGCNLRCPYCHNPDIVNNQLPSVPYSEILAFLNKRKGMIDGVVLSGGEPTLHTKLPLIVESFRKDGLAVKLDTNGLQPDMISLCNPDYLAVDIKTEPSFYDKLGCTLDDVTERLEQSIAIVRSMGKRAEVRITVAPHFVNEENIGKIADLLQDVNTVYLQQLEISNRMLQSEYSKQVPFPIELLQNFKMVISQKASNCLIRGHE